jgi:FixJ family two-component response regulator
VLPPVIAAVVYRVVHEAVRNVVARRCEPHRPARRAQRVGRRAVGYLLNDAEPEDLIRAVRAAAAGDAPLDPRAARELLAEQSGRPARELSKRERQILALVAAGHANKVIAVRLEQAIRPYATRCRRRAARSG